MVHILLLSYGSKYSLHIVRNSTTGTLGFNVLYYCGRRDGLEISALDFGSRGPGYEPRPGHCVVFLGKTLYSHSASLNPGV